MQRIGYGQIARVSIATDSAPPFRSKGFAHVDFFTPEAAASALEAISGLTVQGALYARPSYSVTV